MATPLKDLSAGLPECQTRPLLRALHRARRIAAAAGDVALLRAHRGLGGVLIAPVEAPADGPGMVRQALVEEEVVEEHDVARLRLNGDRLVQTGLQIFPRDLQIVRPLLVRDRAQLVAAGNELHTAVL